MIKTIKAKYLYFFSLTIYILIFLFYYPKPELKNVSLTDSNLLIDNKKIKEKFKKLNYFDNRIIAGNYFQFKKGEHWYQILPIVFWHRDYATLKLIDKDLKINNLITIGVSNNNFAKGKLNKESIVYSCMKSDEIYYYDVGFKTIPSNKDFKYWRGILFKNLKLVFYKFKPQNYDCLLVITSNQKFFNKSEKSMREFIYKTFTYSEVE